jgi:CheY-like chemotaxis protein
VSLNNNTGLILLVEDNADDIELTLRAFKKSRLASHVVIKRDGQEALDYLLDENSSGYTNPLPTVTLLDLNMPRLNGLDVLKRLRSQERTRTMPIVILTTSDEQCDIVNCYQLGANSYIRKPVDTQDFFTAIQELEIFWTVRNVVPMA